VGWRRGGVDLLHLRSGWWRPAVQGSRARHPGIHDVHSGPAGIRGFSGAVRGLRPTADAGTPTVSHFIVARHVEGLVNSGVSALHIGRGSRWDSTRPRRTACPDPRCLSPPHGQCVVQDQVRRGCNGAAVPLAHPAGEPSRVLVPQRCTAAAGQSTAIQLQRHQRHSAPCRTPACPARGPQPLRPHPRRPQSCRDAAGRTKRDLIDAKRIRTAFRVRAARGRSRA
jgi:hypothetical protein